MMSGVKHNIPYRWSNIWQSFQKLLKALWIYHLLLLGNILVLDFRPWPALTRSS